VRARARMRERVLEGVGLGKGISLVTTG